MPQTPPHMAMSSQAPHAPGAKKTPPTASPRAPRPRSYKRGRPRGARRQSPLFALHAWQSCRGRITTWTRRQQPNRSWRSPARPRRQRSLKGSARKCCEGRHPNKLYGGDRHAAPRAADAPTECSADASLARDEAAARRDRARAEESESGADEARGEGGPIQRDLRRAAAGGGGRGAAPRNPRGHGRGARGARRRAERQAVAGAARPSCGAWPTRRRRRREGVPRSDEAHRGGTSERGPRRAPARPRTWIGWQGPRKARRTAPSASWTRRRRLG